MYKMGGGGFELNIKQLVIGKDNIIIKKDVYDQLVKDLENNLKKIDSLSIDYANSEQNFKTVSKEYKEVLINLSNIKTDFYLLQKRFDTLKINYDELLEKYNEVKDYNAKVTINPKSQKRRKWKILKGVSAETTGLLKQNGDKYKFDVILRNNHRVIKEGTFEHCSKIYEIVQKTGLQNIQDLNHLNNILQSNVNIKIKTKNELPPGLNSTPRGFVIQKKSINFGSYNSLSKAVRAYDYLDFHNWDTIYSCKQLKQDTYMAADELYDNYLLGFLTVDIEYRNYWRDNGGLSLQNICKKWNIDLNEWG